ncbi:PREDICTED: megakaryocyte-associated tyrosine-protein kinase [Nanorana parkeri]|uniref:megakaryocyte-associated tyrosine-protein kinase n=1 Tax=Nanorana parkeri TaxID=125878 RepID=UPI000854CF74|nr:PREDICTED: megakaryocyte-associated tyrosine-protein kinase [Nanorana parkeri]
MPARFAPGMQYITRTDNTNPKSQELAFQKGDLVTIISTSQKRGWFCARHHPTGLEGLIPANVLRERPAIKVDSRLSLMPWFHGSISGVQAVEQLQTKENGLFLVRESIRHPGDYVLCVSHQGEVVHYRIHRIENTLTIDPIQKFRNLIDMIEFYTIHQGVLSTKLLKPKPKQGTKSAEEELSKAGWLLSFQRLTLGKKIGQGEFGDVLEGEYMGQPVAIKNIKCDITATNSFLAETAIMTTLKHKNLVNLLGVVLHNGLYIVMEFMSKGNLGNYLRSRGRVSVPPQQLIFFCLDVAEGMEYLEEKRLVHRDLAARNILISGQGTAKVSDFGLSQSKLLRKDQCERLPIKWTAPEALLHNKFSSRSDVWSFGIFLWEVYAYGRGPYPSMTVKEVYERVCNGYRLEAPESCPCIIYSLMRSCWEDDPAKRPSFKKLKEKLEKLKAGNQ